MKSHNKLSVVYTCITDGYDELHDHSFINQEWDYVCFTDNPSIGAENCLSWEIRPLIFSDLDGVRNQRWHKLHPHVLFPDHKESLWVDANINVLTADLFADVDSAKRRSRKISIPVHPIRKCIFDELEACISLGKDARETMEKQIELIKQDGFPANSGLFETNILFREHHDKIVIGVMDDWWWWIEHFSRRDQLSLTYVLWKNGVTVEPLSEKTYRDSDKIGYSYNEKHITKEELLMIKKQLQQQVDSLRQHIQFMESSKFWKMRTFLGRVKRTLIR